LLPTRAYRHARRCRCRDVAVVKVVEPGGEPVLALVAEHKFQAAGELVQVLAGVEQGELRGEVPDR
jgi:hypothetical protein